MSPLMPSVITKKRILHALEIRIFAKNFLAIIAWPAHDSREPCWKFVNPSQSWMTIRAGDEIFLRREGQKRWEKRQVESVTLYRVYPVEYNGMIVSSAQDWLDGGG